MREIVEEVAGHWRGLGLEFDEDAEVTRPGIQRDQNDMNANFRMALEQLVAGQQETQRVLGKMDAPGLRAVEGFVDNAQEALADQIADGFEDLAQQLAQSKLGT